MRVVALADSLSLPRDDVPWEETWPFLLNQHLARAGQPAEVINCGARNRMIDSLKEDFKEHIVRKRPDVVVLQIGIVDCSPRVFAKWEREVVNLSVFPPWVRQWLIERRTAHRSQITARDPLSKVYSPPDVFQRACEEFGERIGQLPWPVTVLVLPILAHRERMEEKSPGHASNLERYNQILAEVSRRFGFVWFAPSDLIPPEEASGCFTEDGYHLAVGGNRWVARRLAEHLRS